MTVSMIFPSSVASWALTTNGTKRNQQSRVHFMDLSLACVGEKPSGKEGQRPALETFARRCANRTRWVVRGSRLLTRGLDVDAKHQTCRFVSACARAAPLQGSTRTFAPLRLCVRFSS